MGWDDKAPSDAELKKADESVLDAPPTADELAGASGKPSTSTLEALAGGYGRGGTLGFADEASGALGAGLEGLQEAIGGQITPPISPDESILKRYGRIYSDYKNAAEKHAKQQFEDHPVASTIGEIAGGFAAPIPGLGPASNLGKFKNVAEARAALKAVGGAREGAVAAKRAEALKGLLAAGAKGGAVLGAGMSSADLVPAAISGDSGQIMGELGQLGVDTGVGAVGGAVTTAAVQPAISALAKVPGAALNIAKDNPYLQNMMEIFKRGKAGDTLFGLKAKNAIEAEGGDLGENLFNQLITTKQDIGSMRQAILKQAPNLEEKDIQPILDQAMAFQAKSNRPEAAREAAQLKEMIQRTVEGKEVRKIKSIPEAVKENPIEEQEHVLRNRLVTEENINPEDVYSRFEQTDDPNKVVGRIYQRTKDAEGQDNGVKILKEKLFDKEDLGPQFKQMTERVREGGKDVTNPEVLDQLRQDIASRSKSGDQPFVVPEIQNEATGLAKNIRGLQEEKIPGFAQAQGQYKSVNDAIRSLNLDGVSDPKEAREKVLALLTNITEQTQSSGGRSRRIFGDFIDSLQEAHPELAQELAPQLKDFATRHDLIRATTRGGEIGSVMGTIGGKGLMLGNLAGKGVNAVHKAISTVGAIGSDMGKGIIKYAGMDPEKLRQTASMLAAQGGKAKSELARVINEASNKDVKSRNAIFFGLMQNPAYRELLQQNHPDLNKSEPDILMPPKGPNE